MIVHFLGMSDEEEGENGNGTRSSESKMEYFVPRRSVKKLQLKSVSSVLDGSVGSEDKKTTEGSEPVKVSTNQIIKSIPLNHSFEWLFALQSLSPAEDDDGSIIIPESRAGAGVAGIALVNELRNREELDDSLTVLNIRRPHTALLNNLLALDRSGMSK